MDYYIEIPGISLERTLFCGQAFRWHRTAETCYFGIVGERELTVRQETNGLTLLSVMDSDIPFWVYYFDADTDYTELVKRFSLDDTLKKACEQSKGLRVLRQPPFETLISFIISQNNNIKRISGIIERLCENFGEPTQNGFAFPSAQRLASISVEELAVIRTGFRARYIIDAAIKVCSNEICLDSLFDMTAAQAKAELMKIVGVGDKVADCVLLFAYGKTESVPKDVWIKRALVRFYPDGLPECVGEHAGIAQQFLFDYIRNYDN